MTEPSWWARASTIKQVITITLLVGLPGCAGAVFLWDLHTPRPRQRTAVVISRNSLLPHRFAGPCINCHRIKEVGPVAMNRHNMQLFNLSPQARSLLLAGQQVQVPTLMQQLRVPAILRSDRLPHPFVGVCSNCHIILDIRPDQAFWRKAMRRAYQPLTTTGVEAERIARGGIRERHSRELYRNIFGFVALGLFILACVYVVLRTLVRYKKVKPKEVNIKQWFTVHEWASSAFCLAAIAHWYFSDRGNNFLHLALVMVVWLTAAGYVLRYRMAQKNTRKPVQLVHTQRFVFLGLIVLLVAGHFFAEFY